MTPAPYPIPHDVVTPCADDPDLMFTDQKANPARVAKAKKVCEPCRFKDGCLMWAVTRGEQGVWAGTTDKERDRYRREHGITVVRPKIETGTAHGPTKDNLVPHGTSVGVESHRKRYQPLCDTCQEFDAARKPVAS